MFRNRILLSILIVFFVIAPVKPTRVLRDVPSHHASFSVEYGSEVTAFKVNGLFVMPNEKIQFKIQNELKSKQDWTAPATPGDYQIKVTDPVSKDFILFNAFVMVPATEVKNGVLNGYKIGTYPEKQLNGLSIYEAPQGFIEVTEKNKDIRVSPHFTLGQFLCKQTGSYPKYVVLKERLLLKLELLWEEVNAKGHKCDTLHVMSGYRTPYYNKSIGNVAYSRHMWGDASDVFIDDQPQDFYMDDLNNDGHHDHQDGIIFHEILSNFDEKPEFQRFVGGLGYYKSNSRRGPFVHVDTRGLKKRWGHP